MTEEQLIDLFHIIFDSVHSNGFMRDEVKDLLFHDDYWFLEKPKERWYENTIQYLNGINYDINQLNINPLLK